MGIAEQDKKKVTEGEYALVNLIIRSVQKKKKGELQKEAGKQLSKYFKLDSSTPWDSIAKDLINNNFINFYQRTKEKQDEETRLDSTVRLLKKWANKTGVPPENIVELSRCLGVPVRTFLPSLFEKKTTLSLEPLIVKKKADIPEKHWNLIMNVCILIAILVFYMSNSQKVEMIAKKFDLVTNHFGVVTKKVDTIIADIESIKNEVVLLEGTDYKLKTKDTITLLGATDFSYKKISDVMKMILYHVKFEYEDLEQRKIAIETILASLSRKIEKYNLSNSNMETINELTRQYCAQELDETPLTCFDEDYFDDEWSKVMRFEQALKKEEAGTNSSDFKASIKSLPFAIYKISKGANEKKIGVLFPSDTLTITEEIAYQLLTIAYPKPILNLQSAIVLAERKTCNL